MPLTLLDADNVSALVASVTESDVVVSEHSPVTDPIGNPPSCGNRLTCTVTTVTDPTDTRTLTVLETCRVTPSHCNEGNPLTPG